MPESYQDEEPKQVPTDDPQDLRDNVHYWLRWIEGAKKKAERHWLDANDAYAEYENDGGPDNSRVDEKGVWARCYPIYKAACETLRPAYYARTPIPTVRRHFDYEDPDALTASLIVKRVANHVLEISDFDDGMVAAVLDYIHSAKAATQAVYSADMVDKEVRKALQVDPTGTMLLDEAGQPYAGVPQRDENGFFYTVTEPTATNQTLKLSQLCYDEVLHTPEAKMVSEIKDMAYWFSMDYDDACKRFCTKEDGTIDKAKSARLPWKNSKDYERKDDEKDSTDIPGKYIEGWECWSIVTKKVYWVCPGYDTGFLCEPKEDPYKLRTFFPSTPFKLASKPRKSLYPTPIYIHLKPTLDQLHKVYYRNMGLFDGIRRRAIVDNSEPDLIAALNDLEGEAFIGSKGMTSIIEKGGLANLVQFIPVKELVDAIGETVEIEKVFETRFNEWFGVPDILRGVSDPIETATTGELRTQAANDRFKFAKKQIADLAKDSLIMLIDLFLGVANDEKMMEVAGYQYMDEGNKSRFAAGLKLARNDFQSLIRVDIETDSTSFIDETRRHIQQNTIATTVNAGIQAVGAMPPEMQAIGFQTILLQLEGMQGGEKYVDGVKALMAKLAEMAAKPRPEPPPDPKMLEIQMKDKHHAEDLQLKSQEIGIKAQQAERDNEIELLKEQIKTSREEAKTSVDTQVKLGNIELARQKADTDAKLELAWIEVEKTKTAIDTVIAKTEMTMAQQSEKFQQLIQSLELKLEQQRQKYEAVEGLLEESRLRKEVENQTP